MKHILENKTRADFATMTVKMLRKVAVSHLSLGKFAARTLKESRRIEFGELATTVIQEMLAKLPEPMPDIPQWLHDMEDEDASTAIYLVTFAKILEESAMQSDTPLKTLDGLGRADIGLERKHPWL